MTRSTANRFFCIGNAPIVSFCHKNPAYSRRSHTAKTPNPSIKRTVKGLRPSPAAYVKR